MSIRYRNSGKLSHKQADDLGDAEAKMDFEGRKNSDNYTKNSSRKIRKVNPLGMRVVVRILKEEGTTDGGLYLPEGARQASQDSLIAFVEEVASALDSDSDEETNVSGIPLGATVLIPKMAGVRVPWDDALRIVETKEILAIINEIVVT